MMFPFGKPVAEPSLGPGEVAMAQWDTLFPMLLLLILRYSFAVLSLTISPALTPFPR